MKEEIKPCPHCGGESFVRASYSSKAGGYFVFVRCDICGAQGKAYFTDLDPKRNKTTAPDNALRAWNMRINET